MSTLIRVVRSAQGKTEHSPPFTPSPSPFLYSLSSPLLPLRNKPPLIRLEDLGEHCKLSSGVWGSAPAEIKFGAILALKCVI